MKNFMSCAGLVLVVGFLTLFTLVAVTWGVIKFDGDNLAMGLIVAVVIAVILGVVFVYYKIHTRQFLKAVQKERPGALVFWAQAPPEMVHPFEVTNADLGKSGPASVVVTASSEAFEIWMDMELKGPCRVLPNTKDLKFNRGTYYFGMVSVSHEDSTPFYEKHIYHEAIGIRDPNGDDLVFKTKDLSATLAELEEIRR